MKFSVQKTIFADAIQKLTSIISSRTTLPVLNNVLIKAEAGVIILETTDLDVRITTKIQGTIDREGSTTVPAKKLLLFAKDFKGDKVNIESDETFNLKLNAGDSSYKLFGISPEEFPVPPTISTIRKIIIPQIDLFRHLNLVSYASSIDESRKILNGVLLSVKSNMLISVATDGKRLALLEKPIDKFEGSEGDVVFHSRVANEIQRIMTKDGNTEIEIGEKIIKFKMGETSLTSKILEGNFPNYRQIIPTSFSKKIEINKDEFHISLRRIMNVISESSPLVTLTFSTDKITITANSSDIGEGVETLPIKYSGSDFKLLLNPNNLSDPLKNMNINKFVFQINDGFSPISLLGDEGFLYIMMPVRNK